MRAALPQNETERLSALYKYDILDTPPEPAFDRLTRIAAYAMDAPIALVSLVDRERQFLKSCVGVDADVDVHELPRDVAFCAHAILVSGATVVLDARFDARFSDNPLVTGGLGVRFYVGVPLRTKENLALGTLCVIDTVPHDSVDPCRLAVLEDLAAEVVEQLEFRNAQREQAAAIRYVARFQAEMIAAQPQSCALKIQVCSRPKHGAGGDFLSQHKLRDGRDLILLTDVSGHDLRAAYCAAHAQGMIRAMANCGIAICEIFAELNRYLLEQVRHSSSIPVSLSVCAVVIDSSRGELSILNFGSPSPVYASCRGTVETIATDPAPPLGWFEDLTAACITRHMDGDHSFFGAMAWRT